nr:MAG TPA: hypothetical protein [Caudoviricetes sp.]
MFRTVIIVYHSEKVNKFSMFLVIFVAKKVILL